MWALRGPSTLSTATLSPCARDHVAYAVNAVLGAYKVCSVQTLTCSDPFRSTGLSSLSSHYLQPPPPSSPLPSPTDCGPVTPPTHSSTFYMTLTPPLPSPCPRPSPHNASNVDRSNGLSATPRHRPILRRGWRTRRARWLKDCRLHHLPST